MGLTFMFIIVVFYVNIVTANINNLTSLANAYSVFMTAMIFVFIFVMAYFIIGFVMQVLDGFKQKKEWGEV
jgi:hypothetical protein